MMTDPDLPLEHRIARDLGGMTVEEMRARMSNVEFQEHAAYYKWQAAMRSVR